MDRISQRLQSLVKTFSEIHQYSHDVHWITCRDFKYAEYISPSFEEIWGCSPRDILEDCRAWDSHVLPIDLKNHHPFLEMIKRIKEVGPSAQYNEIYRIVRPDGCIKWILDRGHPLYDENGEYIGVTGVATDVTWLKHHDALLLHSSFEFPQDSLRLKYVKQSVRFICFAEKRANR
jgi:PAS domain S-box-containing protein